MTASNNFIIEPIEYHPGGAKQPVAVINLDINGREYVMDLLTYNEFIEAGKTEFIQIDDQIKMVTKEEAMVLKQLEKNIKKWREDIIKGHHNETKKEINNIMSALDKPVKRRKR